MAAARRLTRQKSATYFGDASVPQIFVTQKFSESHENFVIDIIILRALVEFQKSYQNFPGITIIKMGS